MYGDGPNLNYILVPRLTSLIGIRYLIPQAQIDLNKFALSYFTVVYSRRVRSSHLHSWCTQLTTARCTGLISQSEYNESL